MAARPVFNPSLLLAAIALLTAPATAAAPEHRTQAQRVAAEWVQDELRPFSGESEFRRYMRDLNRADPQRRYRLWRSGEGEAIVVTGSRIVPRNASITNVQEPGVDEGDVVKQIGRFLIVLQDGRLFSIDTQAEGAGRLALGDRINVYRRLPTAEERERGQDWYDELLVRGDRMVVTGYSYSRQVSEIAVFRLRDDGRFEREGHFEISSEDYFSRRNYATRLIGDHLLIYTPFELGNVDAGPGLPTVRRVEDRGRVQARPRPLLDYRNLYGPLTATQHPTVHSVSICPLGDAAAGRDLSCRTRGFIGPSALSFYVSPTHVYFWIGPDRDFRDEMASDECPDGHRASIDEAERAAVYRIPVAAGDPAAVRVRGEPFDQFSFDEEGGALRAFVNWESRRCYQRNDEVQVAYVSVPLSRFSRFVEEAPASAYVALPPARDNDLANRFTQSHLAYAPIGEQRYDRDEDGEPDYETARPAASQLTLVPLARPTEPRRLSLDHNVRRLEVLGDHFLAAGSSASDTNAAALSLVDVAGEPRLGSSLVLPRVSGGEERSHAFNLLLRGDGSALFGLPTITEPAEGWAAPDDAWWSLPSDLSFFSVDGAGRMQPIGVLASTMPRQLVKSYREENMLDGEPDEDNVPGYSCEVSCVDWYGNSRPIFTGGRIFALSATELIEGRLDGGRIVEVQRLDFARARSPGR
ncbi:MAG TPA: beta-propeller domain-containing protein [Allosphingosinicella sp.]